MKLEFDDVVKQINLEKARGKHSLQIKVLQYELFKDKKPKMLCQQLGYKSVGDKLAESGYYVDYKTTSSQVSTKVVRRNKVDTLVSTFRNLHTTNMIIKW